MSTAEQVKGPQAGIWFVFDGRIRFLCFLGFYPSSDLVKRVSVLTDLVLP
jgi:hypothetical protein